MSSSCAAAGATRLGSAIAPAKNIARGLIAPLHHGGRTFVTYGEGTLNDAVLLRSRLWGAEGIARQAIGSRIPYQHDDKAGAAAIVAFAAAPLAAPATDAAAALGRLRRARGHFVAGILDG